MLGKHTNANLSPIKKVLIAVVAVALIACDNASELPEVVPDGGPEPTDGGTDASPADTTAPVVESATVEDQDRDTLVVVFNEVIGATDLSGFSLEGTTASLYLMTGSGTNTLTITLSSDIVYGETVTLSYNRALGDVVDGANNPLATFNDFSVTNNIVSLCQDNPCDDNGHDGTCTEIDRFTYSCDCVAGAVAWPATNGSCYDDVCLDPAPCTEELNQDPASCVQTSAFGFSCECAADHVKYPEGSNICIPDPCDPDPCGEHSSSCSPTITKAGTEPEFGFNCECIDDYMGPTCSYLDPCKDVLCDGTDQTPGSCVPIGEDPGDYRCDCEPGFARWPLNSNTCLDDPCDPNPCDATPNTTCVQGPGTDDTECVCAAGFHDDGGGSCIPDDNCTDYINVCNQHSRYGDNYCRETDDGLTCQVFYLDCVSGYDGEHCDQCSLGNQRIGNAPVGADLCVCDKDVCEAAGGSCVDGMCDTLPTFAMDSDPIVLDEFSTPLSKDPAAPTPVLMDQPVVWAFLDDTYDCRGFKSGWRYRELGEEDWTTYYYGDGSGGVGTFWGWIWTEFRNVVTGQGILEFQVLYTNCSAQDFISDIYYIVLCGDGHLYEPYETCDDGFNDACGDCDAVCSGPGVGQCETTVFVTEAGHNGDFASDDIEGNDARTGLNNFCQDNMPAGLSCTNVHALITVNRQDSMVNLSGWDRGQFRYSEEVQWYHTGTQALTKMANNWSDMLDGTIEVDRLTGTGVDTYVWTGSNPDGTLIGEGWKKADRVDFHCNYWTSAGSDENCWNVADAGDDLHSGVVAFPDATTSWLRTENTTTVKETYGPDMCEGTEPGGTYEDDLTCDANARVMCACNITP